MKQKLNFQPLTQLATSKLVTAYCTHVLYTHTIIVWGGKQVCRQFRACSLPVIHVAHMQLQTRKVRSPIAEQSLGIYNIRIRCLVFELCIMTRKGMKKKERKKLSKIEVFMLVFQTLRKVGRTFRIDSYRIATGCSL